MFSTLQEVEKFFKQRQHLGMKPGLERIHELLKRLGNPEKKMNAIHIAGTNGKGSTLNFIKVALLASNYDVGVFTSPSFHGLRGHIFLNDDPIPTGELIFFMNQIYPQVIQMDKNDNAPTEFEILTALAFSYFAENGEIILIETGMGGQFDTTNSFHPILSIITNVTLDHTQFLGETTREIAKHKAGIIKKGSPVIVGTVDDEALSVIVEKAKDSKAPIFQLGRDFHYEQQTEGALWRNGSKEFRINLQMKGEHQLQNVSLSLRTLEQLESQGYLIDWQRGLQAIEGMEIPGRFERIHTNPTVIIDAAHNPDGIKAFIKTVEQQFPESRKHVIVAMFGDKATDEMLRLLHEKFNSITLTSFNHPRAWDLHRIEEKWGLPVRQEFQEILNELDADNVYFITGSLHFITEVREFYLREK